MEHPDEPPPPAVLPAETPQNALPSLVAKLADIPEEEIWLAKQKSKRTRRAYKLDVQNLCAPCTSRPMRNCAGQTTAR